MTPKTKQAPAEAPAQPKSFVDLWPLPWPPIVVVTGEFGCGKSTFTQDTGAAPERHFVVDFEQSQKSDSEQLPFTYIEVDAHMQKVKNGAKYTSLDIYLETVKLIDEVQPGQYDILVLDNASIFEDGHAAYVDKNPGQFGISANQLEKAGGLRWGAIKNLYQANLTRWASKFKIVFIIVHLRDKWVGREVVKDARGLPVREPKGKDTLEMLASLFVWLEAGQGGIPSANVIKSRMAKKQHVADPDNPPPGIPPELIAKLEGEPGMVIRPILPLRLPKCTWRAIRSYMRNPADLNNPGPGETVAQKALDENDKLRMRANIARDEATTELARAQQAELAERRRVEQAEIVAKQEWATRAIGLGYKLENGKLDVEGAKAVLEPKRLWPNPHEHAEASLEALRSAKEPATA